MQHLAGEAANPLKTCPRFVSFVTWLVSPPKDTALNRSYIITLGEATKHNM